MIGLLKGQVLQRQPPHLLLEVNGVGYELEVPMSTFYQLPPEQETVLLYTHLAIREDAHVLYGFAREADRTLFRSLLRVSGVGGKMALAILSGMTADEFALAVQTADTAALTRLPGIGKRTAERLIVEMRDRLQALPAAPGPGQARAEAPPSSTADAISALVSLGYRPAEASRMVREVAAEGRGAEELIREALQNAARK